MAERRLSVSITVKITKEELHEAQRCIEILWPGAPVSQSAMIRHLMKRGCTAVHVDEKMRRQPPPVDGA